MSAPPESTGIGRLRFSRHSDERLLAASSQGDQTSFDELHRRYRAALYGYCLLHLRDHQAAEDAVQEVFLRAAAASGSTVSKPRAWLYTLAHNVVIDATRKRKTQAEYFDSAATETEESVAPADALFSDEATGTIFLALRRLPARQRKALVLREFHDMSSADIARELETTPANADVLVSRARSAFGEAYSAMRELPVACRDATEIIYRDLGSGVSATRAQAMHVHLAGCERCMTEYRRAHTPRYLQGMAFLFPTASLAMERASQAAGRVAHAVKSGVASIGTAFPSWPVTAKAGVGLALAATALSPAALHQATFTRADFEPRLTSASLAVVAPKATDSHRRGSDSVASRGVVISSAGAHESDECSELTKTHALTECETSSNEETPHHSPESEHTAADSGSGAHTAESDTSSGHTDAENDAREHGTTHD